MNEQSQVVGLFNNDDRGTALCFDNACVVIPDRCNVTITIDNQGRTVYTVQHSQTVHDTRRQDRSMHTGTSNEYDNGDRMDTAIESGNATVTDSGFPDCTTHTDDRSNYGASVVASTIETRLWEYSRGWRTGSQFINDVDAIIRVWFGNKSDA